ncbi:MAG: hypothetical protein M1816_001747 [Peltula sp. TS41687]|nr:MAG: hypothetical protein M1816_001747 [Peltula sp. TS41687]
MSSPQTPTASPRQLARSTPTSTRDETSPALLTPRSKVQAMLAAIDDDASDADDHGIVNAASTFGDGKLYTDQDIGEPESSDDDDKVASRPRGKMARKMQVDSEPRVDELEKGCALSADNAYDRIRRQIMQRKASRPLLNRGKRHNSSGSDIEEDGVPQPARHTKDQLRTTPDRELSRPHSQHSRNNSPARSTISNVLEKSMSHPDVSDSDLPENPHLDPRILALAEQARQERHAKEAEAILERKKRVDRLQELARAKSDGEDTDNLDIEPAVEKRLTQQVRPTRKASKKALAEMNRETQRISRNMQLTHEARTKKKITKHSLFARFNYKPAGFPGDETVTSASGAQSSSTLVSEADMHYSTAASSPPLIGDPPGQPVDKHKELYSQALTPNETSWLADEPDLPSYDQILVQGIQESAGPVETVDSQGQPKARKLDKGKGKAKAIESRSNTITAKENGASRHIRVKQPIPSNRQDDSDSDLEIIPTSKAKATLLVHVSQGKESQSHPLHVQRMLARLNASEDKIAKMRGSMTLAELRAKQLRDARLQAAKERAEHLEELKRKGIVIQTAEERAKEEATIEEMIERARKETEEISKREKAAAKKAGNLDATKDILDSDDEDEDVEWIEEDEDVAYSGSEEEVESEQAEVDEEEEDEEDEGGIEEGFHDNVQDSNLASTEAFEQTSPDMDSPSPITQDPTYTKSETMNALIHSAGIEQEMPISPTQAENPFSAKNPLIPGLPGPGGIALGLTQIFAGTMADEQTQQPDNIANSPVQNQNPLDFLRQLPAISLPCFEPSPAHGMQDIVKDSQPPQSQTYLYRSLEDAATSQLDHSCSQLDNQNDLAEDPLHLSYPSATQVSDFPDPTQDVGFAVSKPFTSRFMHSPQSIVDTVFVGRDRTSTRERSIPPAIEEDDEPDQNRDMDDKADSEISANVFDVMRKAARKAKPDEEFDRKRSKAKEMVEEQAEESEDEYAGIGGASEDDSANEEEDAEMKDMLDDRELDVDEADLAAFLANKDRADDKRQIEKIYRDVTMGMLRRKRGTDLDLSDSDYDEEARRITKRRKEERSRRALLADEHVEKIATNPKKSAFFQSIEDRGKAEEIDFLDEPDHEEPIRESREESSKRETPSAVESGSPTKKNKRGLTIEDSGNEENRAPSQLRRPKRTTKPATTDEIRECLASLIAPPNAISISDVTDNSDEDGEGGEEQEEEEEEEEEDSLDRTTTYRNNNKSQHPFTHSNSSHPRTTTTTKVIDRLALLRTHHTTSSTTTTRLAFHDSSTSTHSSTFRVPALLRRATTSRLVSAGTDTTNHNNNNSGGGSVTAKNEESSTVVKRAGRKTGCSINAWHAREQQRKVIEERGRKARDGRILKMGRERRGDLGGLFASGKFE